MTEEQKDRETARFLIIDIGAGEIIDEAVSEDTAKDAALKSADDREGAVIGVYQKIGSARIERKAAWKGIG